MLKKIAKQKKEKENIRKHRLNFANLAECATNTDAMETEVGGRNSGKTIRLFPNWYVAKLLEFIKIVRSKTSDPEIDKITDEN